MERNTFLLQDTEAFMRGELDNVTVAGGSIVLDLVQGGYVPYGCYTSAPIPLPLFDALWPSWNAATPPDTAVEMQVRVLVDGNWTAWMAFGKWSLYLQRAGAAPRERGPLQLTPDCLLLDSKCATQAQLRIYLYSKNDKATPAVHLLGATVRMVDVIPSGGRPVNRTLHLMPYIQKRRAPALAPWMDLAISLASLTNRWGADILPEEFAQTLRDWRAADGCDCRNISFAAAAAGSWGFPAWLCWGGLNILRDEMRKGYGAVVALQATPAEKEHGLPDRRFAAVRGSMPLAAAGGVLGFAVYVCGLWLGLREKSGPGLYLVPAVNLAWFFRKVAACIEPARLIVAAAILGIWLAAIQLLLYGEFAAAGIAALVSWSGAAADSLLRRS